MLFFTDLKTAFEKNRDAEKAAQEERYMKHQFSFFGISAPERRALGKEIFKKHPISDYMELKQKVEYLWKQKEREFQYTACDLLEKYKLLWKPQIIGLFEMMIRSKSWWDTVDQIATKLVGPFLLLNPKCVSRMDDWIEDENMWIRRTALLFQARYKDATDSKRLFAYCQKTMHEKEFFIRKAIGCALREY
jgi:3-methyladenine DNA glycosylase AlkD